MDLWVVAAAAGAGCIAKNLQNFSADKKESPLGPSLKCSSIVQTESRNFLQQLRDKTCPLRRLAQKRGQDDLILDLENHSDVNGDYPEKNGILEGYNLPAGVGVSENQQFIHNENMNLSKMNGGSKLVINRRCRIGPLTSVGSCVDNMDSSCLYPSSMSPAIPVLVTNAMWGENSSHSQFACLEETGRDSKTLSSSLKQFEELKKSKKGSSRSLRSQGAETMLLFITGMTVGIVSATTSWKNEVHELNRQLKQMQSLVQDLHDELDLKDMVMVKEQGNEGNLPPRGEEDSPLSTEEPVSSPSLAKAGEFDWAKAEDKQAENLELLSRIEAELQAELEMLELNMKVSDQDRISSVVELYPDFEPEIVRGELKPATVEDVTESESRTTDTMTESTKPANYTVSPWELSLRLHELIESRLETRIKELEIALSHSQNSTGRRYSYSKTESSATHHSPTCICDEHDKRDDVPSDNNGESGRNGVEKGGCSINRIQNGDYDFMGLESNEDSMSEDEGSDETEMLLIKQITERWKLGSSFNFKI